MNIRQRRLHGAASNSLNYRPAQMAPPSSKVNQALLTTLLQLEKSPDLSAEDKEWVRQYAIRLMAGLQSRGLPDEAPESLNTKTPPPLSAKVPGVKAKKTPAANKTAVVASTEAPTSVAEVTPA